MELYRHELDKDVLIVAADGGLDSRNTTEFQAAVQKIVESGTRKLIIDCAKLDYISSGGLGALVNLHKRMQAEGADVKIAGARSVILDVMSITRIDRLFEFYPDVNRARLAFRLADDQGAGS